MKSFIALALVALIAGIMADSIELTPELKARAREISEQCIKQENISEGEIAKLQNRDFANPSDNLKCFTNCFFEQAGTVKDGAVLEDVVLEKLGGLIGEAKTGEIMAKCNGLKGANNCETAFKLYECYENEKVKFIA